MNLNLVYDAVKDTFVSKGITVVDDEELVSSFSGVVAGIEVVSSDIVQSRANTAALFEMLFSVVLLVKVGESSSTARAALFQALSDCYDARADIQDAIASQGQRSEVVCKGIIIDKVESGSDTYITGEFTLVVKVVS